MVPIIDQDGEIVGWFEPKRAVRIVRAVNSHEAMREALEGMLEWARRVKERNPGMEVANAHAALARGEG